MEPAVTTSIIVPGLLGLFRRRAAGVAWSLLVGAGPLVAGCNYYRGKEQEVSRANVNMLAESKRFVVHQGPAVWELHNPHLNGEVLEGTQQPLSAPVQPYGAAPKKGFSPRYRLKDKSVVLNIVHVYVSDVQAGVEDRVSDEWQRCAATR